MAPSLVTARIAALQRRNMGVAGALVVFVGAVYQYTYHKMKTVGRR